MNRYMRKFLELKCAPDILEIVRPVSSGLEKEISESMAIIERIKPVILKHPNKYNVVDLCAGNALTSIISVFLLPVTHAVAIDKNRLNRNYDLIKRFQYYQKSIFDADITKPVYINRDSIIVASHPCRGTAERIIELYRKTDSAGICIIPCCIGKMKDHERIPHRGFLEERLGKYPTWVLYLANQIKSDIIEDKHIMSDKRLMIYHLE